MENILASWENVRILIGQNPGHHKVPQKSRDRRERLRLFDGTVGREVAFMKPDTSASRDVEELPGSKT